MSTKPCIFWIIALLVSCNFALAQDCRNPKAKECYDKFGSTSKYKLCIRQISLICAGQIQEKEETVLKVKSREEKIAGIPIEVKTIFGEPLRLCDSNFKDMKSFLVATASALGNEPTQKDLDEIDALYWCDCLYKKVSTKTSELDVQSVVEDLIDIEILGRKASLLKGGTINELERTWFTRSLNNGESVMTIWGLSLFECQL